MSKSVGMYFPTCRFVHVQELDVATTPPVCLLLFPLFLLQWVIYSDTSQNRHTVNKKPNYRV